VAYWPDEWPDEIWRLESIYGFKRQ
jgi:hypothetical protein